VIAMKYEKAALDASAVCTIATVASSQQKFSETGKDATKTSSSLINLIKILFPFQLSCPLAINFTIHQNLSLSEHGFLYSCKF
jgi:hypothetical protein